MKKQNLYLCIYKKNNKLYFATTRKLTDRIAITNQDFKTVVLGYKNKIQSYVLNGVDDLKRILPELRQKYACNMYILENKYSDKIQIKFVIFLLGNPFWEVALCDKEQPNDVEEGKCSIRTIQIETAEDVKQAEEEFDFTDYFVYDILSATSKEN